jgi:hypothetical protein
MSEKLTCAYMESLIVPCNKPATHTAYHTGTLHGVCGAHTSAFVGFGWTVRILPPAEEKRCECGAASVSCPTHSKWCPLS